MDKEWRAVAGHGEREEVCQWGTGDCDGRNQEIGSGCAFTMLLIHFFHPEVGRCRGTLDS